VDENVFMDSWPLFRKYAAKGLSFTDCTIVALMKRENIDILLSLDRGFDGIVKRVG
jgi:predicted nucleic acid-binding protein